MRKNFGVKTWLYPMPVFIVAAYDERREWKPQRHECGVGRNLYG